MSRSELEQLQAAVSLELARRVDPAFTASTEVVFTALRDEMRARGLDVPPPTFVVGKSKQAAAAKEGVSACLSYVRDVLGVSKRHDVARCCKFLVSACVRDIENGPGFLNWVTVLGRLKQVRSIMDKEFPGYARSGLVSVITARMLSRSGDV